MKSTLVIAIFILIAFHSAFGQYEFQKTYGYANLEQGNCVLTVPGGYVVAGTTTSFGNGSKYAFAMKLDSIGDEVWTHLHGGSTTDEAFSIVPTSDGGYMIAGVTFSYIFPPMQDICNIYMLKISGLGVLQWSKVIHSGPRDFGHSIKETSDHGFILTGYTGNAQTGTEDLLVIKTDSVGAVTWTNKLGATTISAEIGSAVIQTRDGGYAVAGYSNALSLPGDTSAYVVILGANGVVKFTRYLSIVNLSPSLTSPQTKAYDIIQNTNGNLVIVGAAGGLYSGSVYINSPFMMLTDSTGTYISAKTYGFNTGDNRTMSVKQTLDGGYINGGYMGLQQPMLFKTNAAMVTNWAYHYGSNGPFNPSRGQGFSTDITPDGGYVLTGYKETNPGKRIHVIKVDYNGESGCNQGNPNFPGLGDVATVNFSSGTVFSPGSSLATPVITQTGPISLLDTVLCLSTAIYEIKSNNLSSSVFPNPVDEEVLIKYSVEQNEQLNCSIFNTEGKLIYTAILSGNDNSTRVKTSHLPAGIYQLRLYSDSGKSSYHKIVVIH